MHADNFNPLAKTFYRPIDAVLRWCDLMQYEAKIVQAGEYCPHRLGVLFPQWPCLPANLERLYDAIRNGELSYSHFGVSVPLGTPWDPVALTVRHADLRRWMQRHYPDHRPAFLFESIHDTHEHISPAAYLSLQAERDALVQERNTLQRQLHDVEANLHALGLKQDGLAALAKTQGPLSERSENTYLQIIGALNYTVLDNSPAGKPLSVFRSQAAIVDAITARFADVPGLSKRTLDEKFASANRSLKKHK
ncbi:MULTISPECIES: hypothetical protein [unclassified Pseudomonas]|uniref:hypothetical protein n=1 Tax=unclassified Pseudomonas TaxID=196821 RepID=UPI0039B75999